MNDQQRHQVSVGLGIALGLASLMLPSLFPKFPDPLAWAGLVASAAFLLWGIAPLLRGRLHLPTIDRMLTLREAVGLAVMETRETGFAGFVFVWKAGEEQIVHQYFSKMIELEVPVYGRQLPAKDYVRLKDYDWTEETLTAMNSVTPHHKPVRMTDLSVRKSDLKRFIQLVKDQDNQ